MSFSERFRRGPWPEEVVRRLIDSLDRLAQTFRDAEDVAALVLFGSYARGDFGRKSDVDLLVLVRPSPPRPLGEIRSTVVRAMIEAESLYRLPMHLAPLVVDLSLLEELGGALLQAIAAEGLALYGEVAALAALRPDGLTPWMVVRFSAAELPRRQAVQLSRRLHGRGGRTGLIAPPMIDLGRGALLVPATRVHVLREVLDEVGATYDLIPVWRPA